MIIDILIFIAGVIGGVLITLNNTNKVRAIAVFNALEREAQELREKVEKEVKNRRTRPEKKKPKKVLTSPPRV